MELRIRPSALVGRLPDYLVTPRRQLHLPAGARLARTQAGSRTRPRSSEAGLHDVWREVYAEMNGERL